jgi:hypothetical protein
MTRTAVLPEPDLVYLDTNGNGTVDSYVSIDVSGVDVLDGAPAVWRVVETRASRIGLDGLPGRVRVVERVLADQGGGHVEEVSTHEVDLDPVDAEVARELIGRLERGVANT